MKNLPADNKPSFLAWTIVFPEDPEARAAIDIVFSQIAVQSRDGHGTELLGEILECFTLPDGPRHVERAVQVDAAGYRNDILLAYWIGRRARAAWLGRVPLQEWRRQAIAADVGLWMETCVTPVDNFEATNGSPDPIGVARFFGFEVCPYRGYFGAMRDKIPAAEDGGLASSFPGALEPRQVPSQARSLRVRAPENICLIRFGMEWDRCRQEEREWYLEFVHPVMKKGIAYLRDNPVDSRCISVRLADILSTEGALLQRATGLAYFIDLADLENWAWHHPTHLAILKSAIQMATRFDNHLSMSIWHEVHVLPAAQLELEYTNCHPTTGFLPFCPAEVF